jgi:hypothetical protein
MHPVLALAAGALASMGLPRLAWGANRRGRSHSGCHCGQLGARLFLITSGGLAPTFTAADRALFAGCALMTSGLIFSAKY